ncbi:hypothetical protein [Carboxylicivirga sp. N1Y90]|uniref:hypothetical protein n=1 Tax=Carboxylicivirga fragile TaxID=3417571 RepID=UPI003D3378DB|nr:hypothetical protein [Marinilabiliaceae bacterium N1Y90]
MIVGIVALITAIFLGGSTDEYFLITDIDKASKEIVVDKQRSQEIIKIIKKEKKTADSFYKTRSKNLSKFKKGYLNYELKKEDLLGFYETQIQSVTEHQDLVFNTRLACIQHIEAEEWDEILKLSQERFDKQLAKEQKKLAKQKKEVWDIINDKVDAVVTDSKNNKAVKQEIEILKRSLLKLDDSLSKRNVKDSETIKNYKVSFDELKAIGTNNNELRTNAFASLVIFREQVKNRVDEKQWQAIMKTIDKTLL